MNSFLQGLLNRDIFESQHFPGDASEDARHDMVVIKTGLIDKMPAFIILQTGLYPGVSFSAPSTAASMPHPMTSFLPSVA